MTSSTLPLDPVIDFGKHRGTKLSQADAGYLQWMIDEATFSRTTRNGLDWKQLAADELSRRRHNKPIPEGLELVDVDDPETRLRMAAEKEVDTRTEAEKLLSNKIRITLNAVDGAINVMMVEFLTKKAPLFSSYLRDFLIEAIRYGQITDVSEPKVATDGRITKVNLRSVVYSGIRLVINLDRVLQHKELWLSKVEKSSSTATTGLPDISSAFKSTD